MSDTLHLIGIGVNYYIIKDLSNNYTLEAHCTHLF